MTNAQSELWHEVNRLLEKDDPRTQEVWDMYVEPVIAEAKAEERASIIEAILNKYPLDKLYGGVAAVLDLIRKRGSGE